MLVTELWSHSTIGGLVYFLGADIEPVVVEEVHSADVVAVNDGMVLGPSNRVRSEIGLV